MYCEVETTADVVTTENVQLHSWFSVSIKSLKNVAKLVKRKGKSSIPILDSVVISTTQLKAPFIWPADKACVYFYNYDTDTTAIASSSDCDVSTVPNPGVYTGLPWQREILVPYDEFMNLTKLSPKVADTIYVRIETSPDGEKLVVQHGNSTRRIPTLDMEEYPDFSASRSHLIRTGVQLSAELISDLCETISYEEYRPALRTLFIDDEGVVGTDGYTLGQHKFSNAELSRIAKFEHPDIKSGLLLFDMSNMRSMIKGAKYEVLTHNSYVALETVTDDGSYHRIIGRKVDEKYPAYKNVIPSDDAFEQYADLDTTGLVAFLEMLTKSMNKKAHPQVKLTFDKDLHVKYGQEGVLMEDTFSGIERNATEPFVIAFNPHLLLRMLKFMTSTSETNKLRILFTGKLRPAIMTADGSDALALIMPMRYE